MLLFFELTKAFYKLGVLRNALS